MKLKKFEVIYRDGNSEKRIILKAAYYKKRGTTFIFYDDYDQYVQEFEKSDIKDIIPKGDSNYL